MLWCPKNKGVAKRDEGWATEDSAGEEREVAPDSAEEWVDRLVEVDSEVIGRVEAVRRLQRPSQTGPRGPA